MEINLIFFAKKFGGLKYVRIFVSTITQKQSKMITSKDLQKQIDKQKKVYNKSMLIAKESYNNRKDDMLEKQQEKFQSEAILEALESALIKVKEIENMHNY